MSQSERGSTEGMKYAMLGEDRSSVEEKLEKFTGEVPWRYLRPHYLSGVLFFVDPSLELRTVGAAISGDETYRVREWMKTGDIVKIGSLHAAQWEDGDDLFEALVVSPFVLFRPVAG